MCRGREKPWTDRRDEMNKRSAMLIAAGLVAALMSGTVSRVATLHSAQPVKVIVQTVATPAAPANYENDGGRG
jgi:hypothetical protein